MACAEENIKKRDNKEFEKGLDGKVKLALYKTLILGRILMIFASSE